MSGAKRNANGKSTKSSKKLKEIDVCSRVGSNYQVDVPDFVYNRPPSFVNEQSDREINVWDPKCSPPPTDVDEYLTEAGKHRYPEEAARILLHYHKYNVQHAKDDLPNYQPLFNTYNKLEIRRFLKCVDSRPRKNFVNVKESFPAYQMGELHALYYAIAAPFKAIPRHNRKHGRQMQNCYEKALKRGFASSTAIFVPIASSVTDQEESEADGSFERYLCEMLGHERANKIITGVRRGRSATNASVTSNAALPMRLPYGGTANGALPFRRRTTRRGIPAGMTFDYDKFREFVATSPEELRQKQKDSKATLACLDNELKVRTELVESQNKHIFEGLDAFFPEKGFSSISFRWTKSELALLVMALNEYGKDFVKVARILGTKSESLVRDFYNKYKDVYDLDAFINKENLDSEVTETPEDSQTEISPLGEVETLRVSSPAPVDPETVTIVVKRDPENGSPLANGELNSMANSSVSELKPPLIDTTSVKRTTRMSSRCEQPLGADEKATEAAPSLPPQPVVSLTPIDSKSPDISQLKASGELDHQEGNQSSHSTMVNSTEMKDIKEEEEGKYEIEVKKEEEEEGEGEKMKKKKEKEETARGVKPKSSHGKKRAVNEVAAKTALRSPSTESLNTDKRRRSLRSAGKNTKSPPSKRVNASKTATTMQTPKVLTESEKRTPQTRARRQSQGKGTAAKEVKAKNAGRRQVAEGVETKEAVKKRARAESNERKVKTRRRGSLSDGGGETKEEVVKKKKVEAEEPTMSTRRRISATAEPPKKRTRASASSVSSRSSNRKSR